MRPLYAVLTLCVALGLVVGCSDWNRPLSVESPSTGGAPNFTVITDSNVINDYLVEFLGREYADNQTTFSYRVSGTGVLESMTHFTVELPDCAPSLAGYFPTGSVSINYDPNSGLDGIDWHITVGPSGTQMYSITFPGDIPLGVVRAAVRTPSLVQVGEIAGPCSGFEIAGTVFVDSDANGIQLLADEPGIANVTVELVDALNNVQSTVTDAAGHYSFLKVAGTYTVRVPSMTTAADFNEELFESFTASGATSVSVTVGPDATDNPFGFKPNTTEILADFDAGELTTQGEDIKFWRKQLRGSGQVVETEADLIGYLEAIEGLFFPDPFQFNDGNQINEALDILRGNPRSTVRQVEQQLLVAELNYASGRTMNDAELQAVLLSWAESVYIDATTETTTVNVEPIDGGNSAQISRRSFARLGIGELDGTLDILQQMNGTGGGSGGDE